ncbi:predicted protein [Chaetomium globosum CBS 148.51]|uniref:Uncharacterized protein n=1 Tax=Chaetomium globosum (strain ATCC 6205 / CBS 148.51 / DSM 1962 / NBRC 6347 / NRRL 1970) TaxID=306901 RepID=Q2GNJ5_CHAGB|nr:uncharacterized protein CHGG_10459 [Chaetomium globosum CBS 148.51]EAQ84055.1 predicted protein [Chaetomium globosum CBS 148.51]
MSDAAAHMGRLLVKTRRLASWQTARTLCCVRLFLRASSPADSPARLDLSGLNKKWANPQKAPCHVPCPCPCPWLVRRTPGPDQRRQAIQRTTTALALIVETASRALMHTSQPQRLSIEESNEE